MDLKDYNGSEKEGVYKRDSKFTVIDKRITDKKLIIIFEEFEEYDKKIRTLQTSTLA